MSDFEYLRKKIEYFKTVRLNPRMNRIMNSRRNKNKLVNPLFFHYECRFCYDNSQASENLYRVCKCKGSIEWCHVGCLYNWISHKKKRKNICEICNTKYRIKYINLRKYKLRIKYI